MKRSTGPAWIRARKSDLDFVRTVIGKRLSGVTPGEARASYRRAFELFVAACPERNQIDFETWATGELEDKLGLIDAVYGVEILEVDETAEPRVRTAGEGERPDPDAMPMWTIYHDTADFPGVYTVRRCWVVRSEVVLDPDCRHTGTLEEARDLVPPGLSRLPPFDEDDPKIVEVWL